MSELAQYALIVASALWAKSSLEPIEWGEAGKSKPTWRERRSGLMPNGTAFNRIRHAENAH